MTKILVTGANGFLGSWVVKMLLQQGHQVYSLVRAASDLSELQGLNTHFVYGDVTDISSLQKAFSGMDAIFHLAGVIAYKSSARAMMEKVNVQGTANVIEVCLQLKIPRLVHLSSVVAVGAGFTDLEVLNENSIYNISHLNMGYFETKRKAEELVVKACRERQLNAVILNPSTIYGAGDARKGSRGMQLKVAQGKLKFFPKGGVNVVAVEDVVAGMISAWKMGRNGERYILAGENLLIKDLFRIIAEEAGTKPPFLQLPSWLLHVLGFIGDFIEKCGGPATFSRENAYSATMYHWFDASKAKRDLNFQPRPAREAIANSVRWIKENKL